MMKYPIERAKYSKKDFPVEEVRRFLEPGPVVLISSRWVGKNNIMTLGWHMIIETQPSIIACYIWNKNHSYDMIRLSKECVINIPEVNLAEETVKIGNCSGRDVDKFKEFNLTAVTGDKVKAPLIEECYANLECKLVDSHLVKEYGIFIFKVVKAHVPDTPKYPKTLHYRGNGLFMISGKTVKRYRKLFKPSML